MAEQTTQQMLEEIDEWLALQLGEPVLGDVKTNEDETKIDTRREDSRHCLVDAVTMPETWRLFQNRGHHIQQSHQRSTSHLNGEVMETGPALISPTDVILIKTMPVMETEWIDDHLADLAVFTQFFPSFGLYHIYGAIAGLGIPDDIEHYAFRHGLYVINITKDGLVQIANGQEFRPKDFRSSP